MEKNNENEKAIEDVMLDGDVNENEKDYVEQSLKIIEHNQLLKTKDFDKIVEIKQELNHNFHVGQMFRSRVEMEVSVLQDVKFPTPDSKYWQSVREQNVHFSELVMLSYEYRKTVQKIKTLSAQVAKFEKQMGELVATGPERFEVDELEAKIEMKKIDIEKFEFILLNQTRTARERIREVLSWHEIMEGLKPHMKHGIDTYEDHQMASYRQRFQNQIDVAKMTGAKLGPAEAANLIGQFETTSRVLKGEGIQLGAAGAGSKPIGKGEEKQQIAEKMVMVCSKCRKHITPDMKQCCHCGAAFKKQ